MGRGIFITGTDTGVGKTYLGAALARSLVACGIDVGVMKPAETGCRQQGGRLVPGDAVRLIKAAQVADALDLVNPYRFRAPLAPAVAAEQEGRTLSIRRILTAYRSLATRHRFVIVEGAGGIMVPLNQRTTYLDLVQQLQLPILVISRPTLGTINHTMLTVMAIQSRGLPIAGIILNDSGGARRGMAERTNPPVIERMTGIPVLCSLPYGYRDLPQSVLHAIGLQ